MLFVLQLPTLNDPAAEMPAWWDDAAEGGGWLGAFGTHVIDQVRTTMGEITRVSASLETLSPRPMTADDTYTVQFETAAGATGLMHSSCATGGQFVVATKVTGTDRLGVDAGRRGVDRHRRRPDAGAARRRPPRRRARSRRRASSSTPRTTCGTPVGMDLAPYTRLYGVMRDRVLGVDVADDPVAGTFADGVANQAVVDAIRSSSADRSWTDVTG